MMAGVFVVPEFLPPGASRQTGLHLFLRVDFPVPITGKIRPRDNDPLACRVKFAPQRESLTGDQHTRKPDDHTYRG